MPSLYRCEPPRPPKQPEPPKPPKKKKINFKTCKKNTINSLHEVEHFLCNFQNFWDYIRLYKNVNNIFHKKNQ